MIMNIGLKDTQSAMVRIPKAIFNPGSVFESSSQAISVRNVAPPIKIKRKKYKKYNSCSSSESASEKQE